MVEPGVVVVGGAGVDGGGVGVVLFGCLCLCLSSCLGCWVDGGGFRVVVGGVDVGLDR